MGAPFSEHFSGSSWVNEKQVRGQLPPANDLVVGENIIYQFRPIDRFFIKRRHLGSIAGSNRLHECFNGFVRPASKNMKYFHFSESPNRV